MRRETAEEVSAAMLNVYGELNRLTLLVQQNESEKEFAQFRAASATVLQIILTDILNRVFREHPELSPAELRRFFPPATPKKAQQKSASARGKARRRSR